MEASAVPALVAPGQTLALSVRGLPDDVEESCCRGGKLRGGFEAVYWLHRKESGDWSARVPVARFASSGPIRLFVSVARCGGVECHGVTAGVVAVVHEVSGMPSCGGVAAGRVLDEEGR